MNRRLLLSYVLLALFVLVVLEIPLGLSYAQNERRDVVSKLERDAASLATLAADTLAGRPGVDRATLAEIADRYQRDTGGRVVIVDSEGASVVDTEPPQLGRRTFASRPEVRQALAGTVASGTRWSRTLDAHFLYVAVPVSVGGSVHGAVRVTFPAASVESRVLRFWLLLAAIAVVVLLTAVLVGRRFALSISRPLQELQRVAVVAGAGDLHVRAPHDVGPPEVRSLAESFNDTVAKLDELISAQEEFVADAAHQLRTPLAALRLRLENLEWDVAPTGRGDLEGALVEVERLSRLVDGLLALARADSAGSAPEDVDVTAVVEERLDAWSALASEQDVRIEAAVSPGLLASVTPGRVEQVLDNLLANALEVSSRGATIVLSGTHSGRRIELHIVDEGPGMGPEERAHAFDRLWRSNARASGSGLGLAIVHRLVTSDGGDVALLPAAEGGVDAVVRLRSSTATAQRAQPARGVRAAVGG